MTDLQDLLRELDETQLRIFADVRATAADLEAWHKSLRKSNRRTTAATLSSLLSQHGAGSVPVILGEDVSTMIDEAAAVSAESILATYNSALARAILAIGQELPEADYLTYRSHLLGDSAYAVSPGLLNWASRRGPGKVEQISLAETATTLNLAVDLFYKNNPDLDGLADFLPYVAACPACQEGLDGNSYPSIREANAHGERIGMFHVRCIHYAALIAPQLAADSGDVWAGN